MEAWPKTELAEETMIAIFRLPDFQRTAEENSPAPISLKADTERRRRNLEPHQSVDHLRGTAERRIENHQPENYSISPEI